MTGPTQSGGEHAQGSEDEAASPIAAAIESGHSLSRRTLLQAMAAVPAAAALPSWAQPAAPLRPLRIVVGFAAGSAPDIAARIVARRMQDTLGITTLVDNRPGAGGLLATREVLRSPPDGATVLLCGVNQISIAKYAYTKLPYDPYKDLAPIAVVTEAPLALVINPAQVPVDNFADYLAWAAKKKPLFIATMGIGTMSHFDAVLLGTEAGNPPELVHYRGTGEALTGLHSGDVQGMFASPAFAMAQVRGGGLRALATTSPERLPMLADVPTLRELGRPQLEINAWFGLFAPAGTPAPLLDRLSDGAVKAVSAPDAAAQLADSGFRATHVGRAAMGSFLQAEDRRWSRIVADAKFHIDV